MREAGVNSSGSGALRPQADSFAASVGSCVPKHFLGMRATQCQPRCAPPALLEVDVHLFVAVFAVTPERVGLSAVVLACGFERARWCRKPDFIGRAGDTGYRNDRTQDAPPSGCTRRSLTESANTGLEDKTPNKTRFFFQRMSPNSCPMLHLVTGFAAWSIFFGLPSQTWKVEMGWEVPNPKVRQLPRRSVPRQRPCRWSCLMCLGAQSCRQGLEQVAPMTTYFMESGILSQGFMAIVCFEIKLVQSLHAQD